MTLPCLCCSENLPTNAQQFLKQEPPNLLATQFPQSWMPILDQLVLHWQSLKQLYPNFLLENPCQQVLIQSCQNYCRQSPYHIWASSSSSITCKKQCTTFLSIHLANPLYMPHMTCNCTEATLVSDLLLTIPVTVGGYMYSGYREMYSDVFYKFLYTSQSLSHVNNSRILQPFSTTIRY